MFKVFPIQNTEERKALCLRVGAEFYPGDMAYRVTIEEQEAGIVSFYIKGKMGCLRQICFYPDMDDFEVKFIAGRVAMNFMDSVGATQGYFISPRPEEARLTAALGYKLKPDGQYFLNTEGFFVEHCKNHPEKEDFLPSEE